MNFSAETERIINLNSRGGIKPRLLLHSCCAPCSSYVLEYLSGYFDITILYYNPNIYPANEYEKRLSMQRKLLAEMPAAAQVKLIEARYDEQEFNIAIEGFEGEREGGERCKRCISLRMRDAAAVAKEKGFDYFATTLSVSPMKDAEFINLCGKTFEEETGVKYLFSDFKKKDGYKRSVELSKAYDLYRQNYCGCKYSKGQEE